ncbi:glutamine synthetase family protein [Pseudonocardia nematodicida]|uniref:Glutamine synthetase family protein n=1 Tax=Pseudonocardia nematodicida TaxID=1206997 RepID=A0ABV1K4L7_9PSEU
MRNVDERPVAEGGGGHTARPMLDSDRGGFVERHELWSEQKYAAAAQLRRVIDELGIELVRVCFVDQHGVLRGKSITSAALPGILRSGLTAPSSLLLKDPSGRSSFAVFEGLRLDGYRGFSGAGDVVLVADPTTFRVLPWDNRTGLLLADLHYPGGGAVPFCTRGLLRRHLDSLAGRGMSLTVGPELEFHVFARADPAMDPAQVGRPGAPGAAPAVRPLTPGAQLLDIGALDRSDTLVTEIHRVLTRLDLPLRSIELEFGPSQFEITLEAGEASVVADQVVLARTAIKQLCSRMGLHATFMSRPQGAETASTGWHLHQSLCDLDTGAPVFPGTGPGSVLSPVGTAWLAGLLEHAAPAAAFSTPTVNGYKRYQPHSLAPDRVLWGVDNKGAMVRVVGSPGDPSARLENRSGEPGANPYLYILSQLVCGLDGLDRGLSPGAPSDSPYLDDAPRLPPTLGAAVDALDASTLFRRELGDVVVDWYTHLKRAEFERYLADVSSWEQREYFDLL